ncbi:UDP-glucose 4-epimerase GalE [Anaerobacillus isosaccharinicus]|uniref:UDP-glucose 4-epimerase n=1 Tax=Anaerobacillus isosaccharinicus TaxID=1532552 RepID=A0A1S2MGD1_9BACI|nr:UDP-glucose 4-epimerase GalE [Anaerobacillus isosaccharinicus]MBA5586520.1 UDP-glucose 4-epimerase GalE [Anaerobacillus isosaccharinicus]QOY35239.1 UDP-glucose 4-epimerase GalE [Anaerobacillus isosaccharinicus]
MAVLVCGGAGYIGSHTVLELLEHQEEVIVVDNLVTGSRAAVLEKARLYIGDIQEEQFLEKIFENHQINAVIHFAANSLVSESVNDPLKYYQNNVHGTLCLLKIMVKFNVKKIVFSSTAATYGEPVNIPILETDPTNPTNPYGETKLTTEKMLRWADDAYGIKHVILRYFNVAGAHIDGKLGEDHSPETHLIPLILQVALDKRDEILIFGADYDTDDGTCVRDYIHVTDIAQAHILALEKLNNDNTSAIYNLGNGKGFSVKEVIDCVRKLTKHPIPVSISPRRPGDPAILIASSKKAVKELGWKPKYGDLETMISSAWEWFKKHPEGYGSNGK